MQVTATVTQNFSALAAALALILICPAGHAQQPTAAQTGAIRANCRSDFMANCSGVQPGGKDALQCLQRNLGKLSGGCQAAVRAISPPAAAPPAAAAAPSPPPAPASAAPMVPAAMAPAAPTMSKPAVAKPAPAAKTVARTPAAVAPVAPLPVAAAPAVPPLVLRPMLPERRIMIMGICRRDAERLCSGLPPIGPAVLDCLAVKAGSLSPTCYEALARVSRP